MPSNQTTSQSRVLATESNGTNTIPMDTPIYEKPRWVFTFDWPIAPRVNWTRWVRLTKCGVGYFGCSSATNTTRTLIVFGWPVLTWKRLEYEDTTDKQRADRYLAEWSKCEKELRGLRLLQMGDAYPDPELRKLLRDSLGINLDEGTS